MKTLRWDTVHDLPPDVDGKTRLVPPRTESRNQLKRLYAQQNWTELLEQADLMFSSGVSHFLLDILWYLHPALTSAGVPWDWWTAVIRQDRALLLERLPGLENLAWNDGSPVADGVTRNWIAQQVMLREDGAALAGKAAVPTERHTVRRRGDAQLDSAAGHDAGRRRMAVRRRGDAQLDSAAGHDAGRRRMACGESRCTDRRRHKRRTGAGAGSAGDGRQSGRGSGAGLDTDPSGHHHGTPAPVIAVRAWKRRWAGYRPVRASPRHASACYCDC